MDVFSVIFFGLYLIHRTLGGEGMKVRLCVVFALVSFLAGTVAYSGMKLSKYPKVYKGGEGVTVAFVPLSPKTKNQALIKVTGIDSVMDGKVYLYDKVPQGRGAEAYTMTYEGETIYRMRTEKGYWSKWTTVYLPDVRDGVKVWYDEKESKKLDAAAILSEYLDLKASKDPVKKLERKKAQKAEMDLLSKKSEEVKEACGKSVAVNVDWKSIDNEQLGRLKIDRYCGHTLDAMVSVCEDEEGKKAVTQKVKSVKCRFGDKLEAKLKGGTLVWTTKEEGRNQAVYARDFLLENL
jgi:hypothetical protein